MCLMFDGNGGEWEWGGGGRGLMSSYVLCVFGVVRCLIGDSVVYNCFHHGEDMECFFVRNYSLVLEQVFDFVHNGEDVRLDSY